MDRNELIDNFVTAAHELYRAIYTGEIGIDRPKDLMYICSESNAVTELADSKLQILRDREKAAQQKSDQNGIEK